ncbi:MAG: SAM-dependent methyltransferase, partial [Pseudomonadota bacterium]
VALLCAAARLPSARFVGLDRDLDMTALARRSLALNGQSGRVEIKDGDVGALPPDWENRFDVVFSNPPFFEPFQTAPPGAGKDAAYLSDIGLEAWVKAMIFAAKPKAPVVLIHRAAELARILSILDSRAGEITVRPIQPYPGAEAKRVLVKARKGLRRGPLKLLSAKILQDSPGGPSTTQTAAALAGGALNWT